jgi:AbrB family looped-hinge helix DNA binding protein
MVLQVGISHGREAYAMAVMGKIPKKQLKTSAEPVRIDNRGRISLPAAIRKAWGLESGDTVFVKNYGDHLVIRRAINPFDILVEHALQEYREGKTKDLETVARELGIDLDE